MYLKSSLLAVLVSLCAVARVNAAQTVMVSFPISGGQTIKCPVTDGGPIPADNGTYKIIGAGFGMDKAGKAPVIFFGFNFSVQKSVSLTRVMIEDVTDEKAILLVDDKNPKIESLLWTGKAAEQKISKSTTPWLFDNKPTIKVFRFTISATSSPDAVMYQPAWYPVQTKAQVLAWASQK